MMSLYPIGIAPKKPKEEAAILSAFGSYFRAGEMPVWQSASTVRIKAGYRATDDSASRLIVVPKDLDVVLSASGDLGLDTGSEASNTWYYLWLIASNNSVSAVFSASATNPTLPSNYKYKHRLPVAFKNDASSNIIPVSYAGGGRWQYDVNNYVSGGATPETEFMTGVAPASTFTAVSVAAFVPQISTIAHLGVFPSVASATFRFRPTGSTLTAGSTVAAFAVGYAGLIDCVKTNTSQSIDYARHASEGTTIWQVMVTGFTITD